jgi:dienelactone hydrolase
VATAIYLAALLAFARQERAGTAHADLSLPNGMPATLYLPEPPSPTGFLPEPRGPEGAAPVVLLVHGYTADRASVSVLARRLASNGYAVLAPDVRGHGANRNPFTRDPEASGLFDDLAAAADWLRSSSFVDGSRLAVAGHSMGAGAALRFAERDAAVDAAVMISGGWALLGPHRPPNALFVYASGDPERIRTGSTALVAKLAGAETAEPGRRYGDLAARDAARALEIPGTDHTTILWSKVAAREILGWLDESFEVHRTSEPELAEPRAAPALLAGAALPLVLIGVGLVAGALAPRWPRREAGAAGLAGLAGGLALALPLVAVEPLASFLAMDVADVLAALLFYAGLALCAGLALRGTPLVAPAGAPLLAPAGAATGAVRSLAAGGAAFAAVYALIAPLGALGHHLVLTPERAVAAAALAGLLLPFFLAFEALVRRGGTLAALGLGLAGKAIVLAMLVVGALVGIVPFVVMLLLAPLFLAFVMQEIAAAALYSASGNRLASAFLQATWLAWQIAALMPMRA